MWHGFSDAPSDQAPECVSSGKHEVEFSCNNGVERAQLSEHHPPRASLAHEADDWGHNAALFALDTGCLPRENKGRRSQNDRTVFFLPTFLTMPGTDWVVNTPRRYGKSLRAMTGIGNNSEYFNLNGLAVASSAAPFNANISSGYY